MCVMFDLEAIRLLFAPSHTAKNISDKQIRPPELQV